MSKLIVILILGAFSSGFGADPRYNVNEIPADLKEGMYAVIRESESRFYINDRSHTVHQVRLVITILNPQAKQYAKIYVGYDKLIKI